MGKVSNFVLNLRRSYITSYQENRNVKFQHFYYAWKLDKITLPKVRLSLLLTRRCQLLLVRRERSKSVRQWSNDSETKKEANFHRATPTNTSPTRTVRQSNPYF